MRRRKVKWQYCARCANCQQRGDVYGSAGISEAADIKDGVYDNICTAQLDPDGDPLNLNREMYSYLRRGIDSGDLMISGSMILQWSEEQQRYIKFKSIQDLAKQFLWEPRQCPFFKLACRFEQQENRNTGSPRRAESMSMEESII